MNIVNAELDVLRREATSNLNKEKRGELGQFFTPNSIASFMASLLEVKGDVKLLDAGAGIGSLSCAFIDNHIANVDNLTISLWEIDPFIQKELSKVLESYINAYPSQLKVDLHFKDFVEESIINLKTGHGLRYTHAILNPPYKKINSDSKHRGLLKLIGVETVNLYSAFLAIAIHLLEPSGELVAIIPRSFCNGPYYKPFRKLLFDKCNIKRIHVFESRRKPFGDDDVLQENIIIHLAKGVITEKVTISESNDGSFIDVSEYEVSTKDVINDEDEDLFIHIPSASTDSDTRIRLKDGTLELSSLSEIGLEVSTGQVVDFRVKELWLTKLEKNAYPLIYPHHFPEGKFTFPIEHKKPNALKASLEVEKMLLPKGNYVLVKRFSSKEEKKRIVAYCYLAKEVGFELVGFENHWNVFHVHKQGLDEQVAIGLCAYLNSTIIDNYFRTFSGHTQVNATDLRRLMYPTVAKLKTIANELQNALNSQEKIDAIVKSYLA